VRQPGTNQRGRGPGDAGPFFVVGKGPQRAALKSTDPAFVSDRPGESGGIATDRRFAR
jgi:hypothetical protein